MEKQKVERKNSRMNQSERRQYLIRELLTENVQYQKIRIPGEAGDQRELLRGLMNVRRPMACSPEFLKIQDEYLQERVRQKGIVELDEIDEVEPGIFLWRGDITRLHCEAIVNAANSGMTGCYVPNHACSDNCIHTFAGLQLRLACEKMMEEQGSEEPTGQAKITPAYNLPCKYIIHTIGPIVQGELQERHEELLESCYRACLELAEEYKLKSIAFCCISTGVFMFPNERAGEIAIETVRKFREETKSKIKVIFNVFKEEDERIYRKFLN